MEENIMKMTNEVVDVMDTTEEITEAVVETNGGLLTKILTCVGVAGACVGGTLLFKNRNKIKEHKLKKQIAKLEKEGFVIVHESELDNIVEPDNLPDESEE